MKKYLLILVLTAFAIQLSGQDDMPGRKGKFFLVPELWLSFGTTTHIEVAPLIGYHVNDRLSVGMGPHYIYQSVKATAYYPNAYKTHVYGFKGFARFYLVTHAEDFLPVKLFSDIFAHAEYEGMSLEKAYYLPPYYPEDGRFIYNALLVGGGFSQRVGIYNSISFMILWNLNDSVSSPLANPVFRVGFNMFL